MSDEKTRPIFCGACRTAADARVTAAMEPQAIVCPKCGREDSIEAAFKEAAGDQLRKAIGKGFSSGLSRASGVTITVKGPAGGSPRWYFPDL